MNCNCIDMCQPPTAAVFMPAAVAAGRQDFRPPDYAFGLVCAGAAAAGACVAWYAASTTPCISS